MTSIEIVRLAVTGLACCACLAAQAQAQVARADMVPAVTSPEVDPDGRVALRIWAPSAKTVRLNAGDFQGVPGGAELKKGDNGVWEIVLDKVKPGAYRYTFTVDNVAVVDPRSPAISESNSQVWSVVVVPGSEWADTKDVPHGAVAEVTYHSTVLSKDRRMHVYTPPGYEKGTTRYPVFYLLHGASDSDDSWSSVGRAGFTMDNLIAAGKAKPMIVVMPNGHTRQFTWGAPGSRGPANEFEQEFLKDILPTVEKTYRVLTDRKSRAIAGLSMGGGQTLNLAIPHQGMFAYVGVFSSGLFGAFPIRRPGEAAPAASQGNPWEDEHKAELDNAEWKKGLKVLWFGTGKDDFLVETSRQTVDLLKKHGFKAEYDETDGGHTWINWRDYLPKFAQRLFK